MIRIYLLLALLALPSFAQWSPASVEFLQKQARDHAAMKDSALTTLWGGFLRTVRWISRKGDDYTLATDLFAKGKINSYLSVHPGKVPLVVFFPGIFGSHETDLAPRMVEEMEKLAAHVLVPPNFLNDKYLGANPHYDKHQPLHGFDLAVVEQIIKSAVLHIKPENITSIHLVGESLGTTVASAYYATNSEFWPLIEKGSLTLLCPPVNLKNAMVNFDKLISEYAPEEKQCSNFYNYPWMLYHFIYQKQPQDMDPEFVSCMKGYLYGTVFLKAANKSLRAYYQATNNHKFSAASNFTDFFKKYQPGLYDLVTQSHEYVVLSSWVKKALAQQRSKIRVLSSVDDFVNSPGSWEEFIPATGLKPEQVLVLPWGGHCAFLGVDGWDQIFMQELELKKGT